MKQLLFTLMAAMACTTINAQTWQWGVRGGGSSDGFNTSPHEAVSDIATDKNGNIYITGTIEASGAPSVGSTSNHVTTYGNKDIIVASFKCDGTFRWSKTIGGTGSDFAGSIGTDTLGHVYVVGKNTPTNVPSYVVHLTRIARKTYQTKNQLS